MQCQMEFQSEFWHKTMADFRLGPMSPGVVPSPEGRVSCRLNNGLVSSWMGLDFSPLGPHFSFAAPSIEECRGAQPCALGFGESFPPRSNLHNTLPPGLNRTHVLISD